MLALMRARSLAAVSALLVVVSACGSSGGYSSPTSPSSPGTPTTTTPAIGEVIASASLTFNPASISVAKGGTVTFTFQGVEHNVSFANVSGAPANIGNTSNASVQRVFATAGTYGFQCTIHSGMSGSVVVN